MAKDDYNVLVYKILLYFYAILKRKIAYQDEAFDALISKSDISDEYLTDILHMMQDEGLIKGLTFINVWGGDCILTCGKEEIRITPSGIHYLEENSKMKKIGDTLTKTPGIVASLINIVRPI